MKKVIIIGAGVAGLATGILAQENGFDTEIFEMHTLPGGLCTGWKRGGYTFDGCIRYVYGSGEGGMLHPLMRRLGMAGREYVHHGESIRVETGDGTSVIFYSDLDRLQAHLLGLSPGDGKPIRRLISAARSLSRANIATGEPSGIREMAVAMVHFVPYVTKYFRISLADFTSGLKSAALREAFLHYYGYARLDDLPLFVLMMDLAQRHVKNAGWPLGGSLALMRDMEERYQALGGKVHYGGRVEQIMTADGKATGIRLHDRREVTADIVVSAADAYATLERMLGGAYTTQSFREAFTSEKLIPPIVQVSLGIGFGLEGVPHNQAVPLREPIVVAGVRYDWLSFKHYGYDGAMAPEGKSAVVAVLETDFGAWEALAQDKERYSREKQSAAAQVISRLNDRYPGLAEKVEVIDVASPLTFRRYTGNLQGSPQGWQTTVGHMGNFPGKLPGLANFYMAGQWVRRGGGLPGGAISAYAAVRQICKDNKMKFR